MLRRRGADRVEERREPEATPAATPPPTAPAGANHLVVVVLDSLRFDSCMQASMPNLRALGDVERRWSYASWTAPSHYNLLMGLLPHRSPPHVYASEYYKEDLRRYSERLNIPGIEFSRLLPSLWLPTLLRDTLGYRTAAYVSMPVLNRHTPINVGFDTYELMPRHNDFGAIVDQLQFDDPPSFHLINVGETHYPYASPDEDPENWPRISGLHGVVKHIDDADGEVEASFFDAAQLDELRGRQIDVASYVDTVLGRLFELVPKSTWMIVTADHGELFGEDGYFGHGPIAHEKVHEVPFVEARIR